MQMELKLSLGEIHPTIVKERLVAGLRLSESVYPPLLKTPEHCHKDPCFSLILSGHSWQTYGQNTRERKPSTMLFYSTEEFHSESFARVGSRIFSIEIGCQWTQKLREAVTLRNESLLFEGGLLNFLARRVYHEFHDSDRVTPLAIEGLVLEIVAEISRRNQDVSTSRPPRWLSRAKDLIYSGFLESSSLSEIAGQVDIHPVYLASAFRRYYGCTVGEYVRKLRIEFAMKQLISSDTPLAQIAVIAGFANQSHFNKMFKRHTGVTPGAYRTAVRS